MWRGKSQFTVIEITKFRFLGKWPDNSLDIYDWMLLQVFLKKNGQKWLRRRQWALRWWQWSVLPLRHCTRVEISHLPKEPKNLLSWLPTIVGDWFDCMRLIERLCNQFKRDYFPAPPPHLAVYPPALGMPTVPYTATAVQCMVSIRLRAVP